MDGLVRKISNQTAEAYLYGMIGRGLDIDVNLLIAQIEAVRREGVTKFVFYVNSDGGEVAQGNAFFNYMLRTEIDVTWIVDGIAASMMAMLITNPKHKVVGAKYSKYMYHRIQGYVYGNSSEVRAHADMIDTFEDSLIDMMATRMKADKATVKKEYFEDGIDHWLSAEQALELGLIDEIHQRNTEILEADLAKISNKRDVWNYYQKQILNLKLKKMDKNMYALAMGLPSNEDESKVLNHLQGLVNEKKQMNETIESQRETIKQLQARLDSFEKAKVTNLINQAIAEKKISEDDKETYLALAEKDYAGVEKIINKLPSVDRLVNKLKGSVPKESAWTKRQEEINANK